MARGDGVGGNDDEARVREAIEAIRRDLQPMLEGLVRDLNLIIRQEVMETVNQAPARALREDRREERDPSSSRASGTFTAWLDRHLVTIVASAVSFVLGFVLIFLIGDRRTADPPVQTEQPRVDTRSAAVQQTMADLLRNEGEWGRFVQNGGLRSLLSRFETAPSGGARLAPSSSDVRLVQTYLKTPDRLTWAEQDRVVRLVRTFELGELGNVDEAARSLERAYLSARGLTFADLRAQAADLSSEQWIDLVSRRVLRQRARN